MQETSSEVPNVHVNPDKSGEDIYNTLNKLIKKDGKLERYDLSPKEQYDIILVMLNNGSSPNYFDEASKSSLLELAIKNCSPRYKDDCENIPLLLLDRGAQIDNTRNLLFTAIDRGQSKVALKLIEKDAHLDNTQDLLLNAIINQQNNVAIKLFEKEYKPLNEELRLIDKAKQHGIKISKEIQIKLLKSHKRLDPNRLTGFNINKNTGKKTPKYPQTAYFILGHGGELKEKYFVPKGCILVTQVHSGELNYSLSNTLHDIFSADPKDKEQLLDPVANYRDINILTANPGTTGKSTLAIYREGDEYPDFKYTLMAYWDSEEYRKVFGYDCRATPCNKYIVKNSGIVKYPFDNIPKIDIMVNYNDDGSEEFLKLYNGAMYPPLEDIIDAMPRKRFHDIITNSDIKGKISIKQSEIFRMVEKNDTFEPGVYYNLVCRASDAIRKVNPNTDREELNRNLSNPLTDPGKIFLRNEQKEAVREALFHRGPLIDKLNLNSSNYKEESLAEKIISYSKKPDDEIADFIENYFHLLDAKELTTHDHQRRRQMIFYMNEYNKLLQDIFLKRIEELKRKKIENPKLRVASCITYLNEIIEKLRDIASYNSPKFKNKEKETRQIIKQREAHNKQLQANAAALAAAERTATAAAPGSVGSSATTGNAAGETEHTGGRYTKKRKFRQHRKSRKKLNTQ